MCGIAGVWGHIEEDVIKEMLQLMVHRGPDAEGMHVSSDGPGKEHGHERRDLFDG